MLFNSIDFILFFPVVTILFFLLPKRVRNVFLLACSCYFYMCWKAKYIVLIGFSILATYLGGLLLDYFKKRQSRLLQNTVLWGTIGCNLLILFVFKYYNFFAENVQAITGVALPLFGFVLPVGISFYTFQALGYVIDVYRGTTKAEKNLITYALFISFYPQLVAGPIERSDKLLPQIKKGTAFSYENMRSGLLLMGWGMFQKVVIADRLVLFVDTVYEQYQTVDGAYLLLATVLFAFQIYCDFASYSNIARGAARVMGYRLMLNFDTPYFSRGFAEYWSRWHISLSGWFQDYIFEPLAWGLKKYSWAPYFAVFVVFFISGFWHGASWTYVIWGLLHAAFRIFGMLTRKGRKKLYKKLGISTKSTLFRSGQTLWVFLCVCFSYIFFRAANLEQAVGVIGQIVSGTHIGTLFRPEFFSFGLDEKDFVVAVISLAVLWVADVLAYKKVDVYGWITAQKRPVRWLIYWALLFSVVIFGVYGPSYDSTPFIYFQF